MARRVPHARDPVGSGEPRLRTPEPPAPVIDLQRSAGNAAVARLLAREPAPGAPQLTTAPGAVPDLSPRLWQPPKLEPAAETAVTAWLTTQRGEIHARVIEGSLSMAELIDQIRRTVPEAAGAGVEALRWTIVGTLPFSVPATRGKADLGGRQAEQRAAIANLFPTPPTSVTFSASKTSVTLGINGAEVKTAADGVHVTAKADQDGAEAEVRKGAVKLGASASWDGPAFAVKTDVGGVRFDGKVERAGENWKWSAGLVIPLAGEEVDELPDVSKVVSEVHAAVGESVGYLRGGGKPTDDFVKQRFAKVKPAIDAAGRIAKRADRPSATLRATASGDGAGGWSAGVSLVVEF